MSANKTKVLLVIGALVLFVLLFISPKSESKHSEDDGHDHKNTPSSAKGSASLEVFLNLALKNLGPEKKKTYDRLTESKFQDSLALFWDRLKRPDLAAIFVEKQAIELKRAEAWDKAGNRYYYSVQFTQDQSELPVLYQRAIFCFEQALLLEPGHVDAKIMLASCYVEGTEDPMRGISALKEIEKTNANNVKLQLTFAFFSVKSGQLDKAIERFNKVLTIDSTYIEAYLHLADTYEKLNEKEKAIQMLESYSTRTNDPTAQIEINKYIQQLKINN